MVHFIIIHLFYWSGAWIWNRFRVKFNWKLWSVNFNITIINSMMIKSPRDSLNHSNGVWSRGPLFEVICWRLAVPLSWWMIWLFDIKGVELIRLYSKTWWDEFRSMDDPGVILLSDPFTKIANILMSCAESFSKCM